MTRILTIFALLFVTPAWAETLQLSSETLLKMLKSVDDEEIQKKCGDAPDIKTWQECEKKIKDQRVEAEIRRMRDIRKAKMEAEKESEEIFNGCIIKEMPDTATGIKEKAIEKRCKNLSQNPGWIDKLRYGR